MAFWPFSRKPVQRLSPEEIRQQLCLAAETSSATLKNFCKRYRSQIVDAIPVLRVVPVEIRGNPAEIERYMGALLASAECLAQRCGSPQLLTALTMRASDNPLEKWRAWHAEFESRMNRLEYEPLIAETHALIEQSKKFGGPAARIHEASFWGCLGSLHFNSGRVTDALEPLQTALNLCREFDDRNGAAVYLDSLMHAHRYLGDSPRAIELMEEIVAAGEANSPAAGRRARQLSLMRQGEPLLRVVCECNGIEWELDEIRKMPQGRVRMLNVRNRASLKKCTTLVAQANELARNERFAEALALYEAAAHVDPYDPDPAYQRGVCLLEQGSYWEAVESFQEVEQLAPGWFHCRTDYWLATQLARGDLPRLAFLGLRALEDCPADSRTRHEIAEKSIDQFPNFAPLWLVLGDLRRQHRGEESAIAAYRTGLNVAAEPDVESRLAVALASLLSPQSDERKTLPNVPCPRRAISRPRRRLGC